jgi:hypothetical protein
MTQEKLIRREYAKAALTGLLLSKVLYERDHLVREAFEIADLCIEQEDQRDMERPK